MRQDDDDRAHLPLKNRSNGWMIVLIATRDQKEMHFTTRAGT